MIYLLCLVPKHKAKYNQSSIALTALILIALGKAAERQPQGGIEKLGGLFSEHKATGYPWCL